MDGDRSRDTFFESLAGFFTRSQTSGQSENARAVGAERAPGPTLSSSEDFDTYLNTLIAERKSILTGKIHLLGLENLQREYGDGWQAVSAKVGRYSRQAIEKYLTLADSYTAYGESGFLIIFGELTENEAILKSSMIRKELIRLLSGETGIPNLLEINTAVAHIESNQLDHGDSGLAFIARLLEIAEKPAAGQANLPRQPESTETNGSESDAGYIYNPVWDVKRNVIATYRCQPTRRNRAGTLLMGYDALVGEDGSDARREFDIEVLKHVTEDLRHLHSVQRKLVLSMAIDVETLAKRSTRETIAQICQEIPEPYRKLLIFEIVGINEDTPSSRLVQSVGPLAPFARAIIARLPVSFNGFDSWRGSGVHAVGFELAEQIGGEDHVFEAMPIFSGRANSAGLRTFAFGLSSISLVTAAMAAGFDYIDGSALSSVTALPEHIYRFGLDDLHADAPIVV